MAGGESNFRLRGARAYYLYGRAREHLEFTVWFLMQKGYVERDDNSRLQLTVEGAEFLEQNYSARQQQKRLSASKESG